MTSLNESGVTGHTNGGPLRETKYRRITVFCGSTESHRPRIALIPVHVLGPHCVRIAAFGGPTDCGSHRPRIAQTTGPVRGPHCMRIPSVGHTADRRVWRTRWLWIAPSTHRTDCGSSPLTTQYADSVHEP